MAKIDAKTTSLVPKLRFPEFRDEGDWPQTPLETIARRVATRNDDGSITRVLTNSAEHGVLDQRDYFDRDIATAGKTDGYFVVDEGDFVYNPRKSVVAPVGPISRNNIGQGVMSPLYTVFRFKTDDTDFFEHYFRSEGWHAYLRNASSTGARHDRMAISAGAFMRMPVPTPSPAEQRKIAACLTSLDELIAARGRKLAALAAHKKGLMQQLFPRPGESLPRLRFPEFREEGEWRSVALEHVIQVASGQIDPTEPPYCELPQIGSENIESGTGRLQNVKSAIEKGVISGNYLFDEDDLLYSKIRPALNKVAAPSFKGICSADIYPVRPASDELLKDFLFRVLLSDAFLDHAVKNSARGKIPKINREALLAYETLLPSPAEQQRIAACLGSLDAALAAETQALSALRTHKKGLMQQLFPSTEAAGA